MVLEWHSLGLSTTQHMKEAMGVFFTDRVAAATQVGEGVSRKILAHHGTLMMVNVEFAAGAVGARHNHPHEQVTYVAAGKFLVKIGGQEQVLEVGDSFYAPSNVDHEVKALEAGALVDIFTPQREDFLK